MLCALVIFRKSPLTLKKEIVCPRLLINGQEIYWKMHFVILYVPRLFRVGHSEI